MTASSTWTKATHYRRDTLRYDENVFWVYFDDGESVIITDDYMSGFDMQALVAGEARRRELENSETQT